MKNPSRTVLAKLALGLIVTTAAVISFSGISKAQDFDDTLESELDALEAGGSSSAPVAKKPAPPAKAPSTPDTDSFVSEEPLSDPFEGEKAEAAPVEKAAPENVVKTPAKKKRAEPLEPSFADEPAAPESAPAHASSQAASLAPSSDEPNSAFEARLSGIYSQHSEPVSSEKWTGLIGGRAAETYSVQAGDTLWDLSHTLFADGFYWSKLWAENPEIHNPHQISKGQAIRFIGGTEANPPEVRVVKEEPDQLTLVAQANFEKEDYVPPVQEVRADELEDIDSGLSQQMARTKPQNGLNQAPAYQEDLEGKITQADLDAGVVIETAEIVPRPVIPPPTERRNRVLLDIPRSFGEYKPLHYDKSVTVHRRSNSAEKIPGAIVPSFTAFENVPESIGTISEVDQGELIASIGQYVYIQAKEPLTVGSKVYSAVPRFDIKSATSKIGEATEIGGILRIVDRADEKTNLYRAVVIYIVNPVRLGSLILAGEPPRVPVSTKGRRTTGELVVVGGSESDTRHFFGDGSTVFLDTRSSGVRVGDVLAVQARRGARKMTIAPDQQTPIGVLKVFSVSGKVAAAMVVVSTEEIRIGDRTGPNFPQRLPDLRIEAPRVTQSSTD